MNIMAKKRKVCYRYLKRIDNFLSEELEDYTFNLDEKCYRLPCPVSEFADTGWNVKITDTDLAGYDTILLC